jgi:nitroreductase
VSEDLIATLFGAAQSASTSSNLQMWSAVSVNEPERREQIAKLCADQDQVRNAPWFFTFLADHHRLREAALSAGEQALGLGYMEYLIMAVIDAALAAERFVCAAESVGLGVCYIGALRDRAPEVKSLLNLPAGVFGVFGLCVGYPKQPLESHIRPRLAPETVWFRERYETEVNISGFEGRMRDFYESEKMRGDHTWAKRSGVRLDRRHLNGREILKEWLGEQGFALE